MSTKKGFYSKLAWNNIKKNYRFYIPRILAEAGLLGCFYIAYTLARDERISDMKGGSYIPPLMIIGVVVLAILSAILVFYTNSFIMKQRRKEFGVYNVLGMEKKHIGRVLFHESFISGLTSVVTGLGFGILFYKICSLLICRLLKTEIVLGMYFITPKTIIPAGMFFILLDMSVFVINLIGISRMNPVELISSRSTGEKEPKVRWLMLILGIAALGGGYYLALTTKSPLSALNFFFLAVLLVIIGTYFLFVTGSIFVLKTMKLSDRFYYDRRRMPAISGLLYRMKQNAVGLASIAILATGVLIMISTTVSLYSGMEGTLNRNYPEHLYFFAEYYDKDGIKVSVPREELENIVRSASDKNGLKIESSECNRYLSVAYYLRDNKLLAEPEVEGDVTYEGIAEFIFITEDTYTALTGNRLNLSGRDVVTCRIASPITDVRDLTGTLSIGEKEYSVKDCVYSFPINIPILASGFSIYGIIVADDGVLEEIYESQLESYEDEASSMTERIAVKFSDLDRACSAGDAFRADMVNEIDRYMESAERGGEYIYHFDTYWETRSNIIGMYGALLFLGILLGAVCIFATVLIIYYKQISEGYEDRERFHIMEKIGMSRAEVKKTINSQVLFVFFIPLIVSGIHTAFAFPMLRRMLNILMLYDPKLLTVCTLITYAVFAIIYTLIYAGTSRTYYRIVH